MQIDLTGIDKIYKAKYKRHSNNVLRLIREAGLEEVVDYTGHGGGFTLRAYDGLAEIQFPFKSRGYKKQVEDFIEDMKKRLTIQKMDAYREKKEKYSIFQMANDFEEMMDSLAEVDTDEEMEQAVAIVEKMELTMDKKAESFIEYHHFQESQVKIIDEKIDRLKKQKKMFQKKVDKDLVLAKLILNRLDKDKIETTVGDIKTRSSQALVVTGQVPDEYLSSKIEFTTEALINSINSLGREYFTEDEEYIFQNLIKLGKVTQTVDKPTIKADIKKGEKIDFAYIKTNIKGVID